MGAKCPLTAAFASQEVHPRQTSTAPCWVNRSDCTRFRVVGTSGSTLEPKPQILYPIQPLPSTLSSLNGTCAGKRYGALNEGLLDPEDLHVGPLPSTCSTVVLCERGIRRHDCRDSCRCLQQHSSPFQLPLSCCKRCGHLFISKLD